MNRSLRFLAVAAGLATAPMLLAACERPAPKVTVLSGTTSTIVRPQSYCFDLDPKHCHTNTNTVRTVTAKAGSTLLVDVAVHDRHSTRVRVPYGVDSYYLVVLELHDQIQTASWVARVTVTS